jgi:hypothetical protein
MVAVRFRSPAPNTPEDTGLAAHIAQSVEHFLGKEEVTGSIPVVGSIIGRVGRSDTLIYWATPAARV